ncbi:MAG: CPBP family intramembrane metalloprotease [Clostridia bacterium]|nr:CPBP family intramembrane metalloprotease [Clostridia bacterium]
MKKLTHKRSITAPLAVLAVFLLLILTRFLEGELLTRENEYVAIIVLQLLIFMLPATIYIKLTAGNTSELRLAPFGLGHLLLIISAIVAISTGSLLIRYYTAGYSALSENYDLYGVFISKNDGGVGDTLYLILAYAALPAVCEETVFRGLLCAEYQHRSSFSAIFMSSLFFAMIHFDTENFLSLFFAGVVLALTLYATRSLLAPIVVHFCQNLLSVFGRPVIQTVYDLGGEKLFIFIATALALLFSFIFCSEAARLYRSYSRQNLPSDYRELDSVPTPDTPTQWDEFAKRFPRVSATLGALFSPTALLCYVTYAIALFIKI